MSKKENVSSTHIDGDQHKYRNRPNWVEVGTLFVMALGTVMAFWLIQRIEFVLKRVQLSGDIMKVVTEFQPKCQLTVSPEYKDGDLTLNCKIENKGTCSVNIGRPEFWLSTQTIADPNNIIGELELGGDYTVKDFGYHEKLNYLPPGTFAQIPISVNFKSAPKDNKVYFLVRIRTTTNPAIIALVRRQLEGLLDEKAVLLLCNSLHAYGQPVSLEKKEADKLSGDLARVIDNWPRLPEHVRQAITTLVETISDPKEGN